MSKPPRETPHPYDGIDLAFLLLSAMVPQFTPLALLQYALRRSQFVVSGLLHLAAQVRGEPMSVRLLARPAVQTLLPGATKLLPSTAPQVVPTLTPDDIGDADNILVVGPKGSGKTMLLQALLERRNGNHCALDPHNAPGKWSCGVVGGGLDFGAIDTYLQAIHSRLTRRYQAMNQGVTTHPRLTLIADEWRAIAHELPDVRQSGAFKPGAARVMLKLITQGRKVGLCFIGAGHADTVEALGITGEGDLRTCFDWIIYLGALAVRKLPEARSQTRPAVAYHPERDTFVLLMLPDCVREQQANRVREQSTNAVREPSMDLLAHLLNDVPRTANAANARSAHQNAVRSDDERSLPGVLVAPNEAIANMNANAERFAPPTVAELRRLAKAIALRTQGRSKQESIEEAFAVSKGGSVRWQRAYALFEEATRE